MENNQFVHVFQIGERTIVGICEVENISQIEPEISIQESEFISGDIVILEVKNPMTLISLVTPSSIDESRQTLTHKLIPFVGSPVSININMNNIDYHYVVADEQLSSQYLKIIQKEKNNINQEKLRH